jgi:glucose/arabinose dehydrogenase
MIYLILFSLITSLFVSLPTAANATQAPNLQVRSDDVRASATSGGNLRGAALAVLENDELLLGGGRAGGELFLYNLESKKLTRLASLLAANRRVNDSRFAINDIAVLSQDSKSANLLVSYPRLGLQRDCVEIVVENVNYDRINQKIKRVKNWLVTKPCVPISAVQHTSGRFAVIDSKSAYVTIGDLGYTQISNRKKRGDLGSIFKVSSTSVSKFSQGHRNAQGVLLYNGKDLLAAEHGPRGGDELNLIKQGGDYGWPFVTYGQPYGSGDYVRPSKTGTHAGFVEPLKYWVPSIAPTELVQLPKSGWGDWSNQLVLGTLREQVLVFMAVDERFTVTNTVNVDISERIRDLEVLSTNQLVATTDSGALLIINPRAS